MDNLELLQRAKQYIDKLANGINPLTGEPVEETDVVNNVRLARCFFYVSDVLRKVIENGGEVQRTKKQRMPFSITEEELSAYSYSDEPISLTHVIERVNALINASAMKKLSFIVLSKWLKEMGLLEDANGKYGRSKTCPTSRGKEMGITIEKRIGKEGEYFASYYNRNAQEFIINHIPSIISADGE